MEIEEAVTEPGKKEEQPLSSGMHVWINGSLSVSVSVASDIREGLGFSFSMQRDIKSNLMILSIN